jgi:hypothetical protein
LSEPVRPPLLDHKRIGAIAADQEMLAEQPNVAGLAYRDCRLFRYIVRIRQSDTPAQRKRRHVFKLAPLGLKGISGFRKPRDLV